jgi:hypothetical protein
MPPVVKELNPRALAVDNSVTFSLPGIRRLHVLLRVNPDTRRETADVWWVLSAWATLRGAPEGFADVNLPPSALPIPPLGAGVMYVATVFWPAEPEAEALSVSFVTAADQPQGRPTACVIGDTLPHDFIGVFRAPFGYPQAFPRIVEPLPPGIDANTVRDLQLLDRLPPLGRAQEPRRGQKG